MATYANGFKLDKDREKEENYRSGLQRLFNGMLATARRDQLEFTYVNINRDGDIIELSADMTKKKYCHLAGCEKLGLCEEQSDLPLIDLKKWQE
jgi:hypothetical protein